MATHPLPEYRQMMFPPASLLMIASAESVSSRLAARAIGNFDTAASGLPADG